MRFDDNAACAVLFGQHHLNLARIEQKLPVSIVTRGNEVFIQGESEGEVRRPQPCSRSCTGSSSEAVLSAATRSTPPCAW